MLYFRYRSPAPERSASSVSPAGTSSAPCANVKSGLRYIPYRERDPEPDAAGLYPHEILLLHYCTYGKYPSPSYPRFWEEEYGIRDVDALLSSLEARGYLAVGSRADALPSLTVSELKPILASLGLPVSGKKVELIARIRSAASEADLAAFVPSGKYILTRSGLDELEVNQYVPYMHQLKDNDIHLVNMNHLVMKYPDRSFRDLLWSEYNRLLSEYMQSLKYDQYRNVKFSMYRFRLEEGAYKDSFSFLAEVFCMDINGSSPMFAPGVISCFSFLGQKAQLTGDDVDSVLSRLPRPFSPQMNFTQTQFCEMVKDLTFSHGEIAKKIFNSVVTKIDPGCCV